MNARLMLAIALARGKGPWLGACALFILVCGGAAWAIVQAQREQAVVEQQIATARGTHNQQSVGATIPSTAADRLAKFHAALGAREDLDQHMRRIYEAARKRNLALDVGEYQLVNDVAGGFRRYQIQLPIDGAFSGIQSFSQQVLLEFPFAALESMTFQRESIDAPIVEAQLRFVLFLSDRPTARRVAAQAAAR
jgi:hypothetical protein